MEFREITAADVPSLFHVRTRTRENRYTLDELAGLGITEQTVVERLSSSFKGWLCRFDHSVVGFCMADRDTGELWVIAVLPDFERRGIGNRLMALAEEWLWASGCNRAWLTTDMDTKLRAYGFYRHRGWVDWKVENGLRWMQLIPRNDTSPRVPARPWMLPAARPSFSEEAPLYSKTLFAGWADMDFNSHMRNTAFLDKSADVRMMFFSDNGFPMGEFTRLKLGPVVMKDEVEYRKEVGLLQEITVTLAIAGHSDDGSRFLLRNDIFRLDGTLCARVTSTGGWLDLTTRMLVAPPKDLHEALKSLPRTSDFTVLPSSIRRDGG